jgi:signal transduction histidine kinase
VRSRIHPDDLAAATAIFDRSDPDVGSELDYENRALLPDGSVKRIHVVARGTRNARGQVEFVGAAMDVTEQRRAQLDLEKSEESLNQVRSELARVARVTSLGVLTASIAHEVNQPLSGVVTNAGTCLRMLSADPPNLDGARETARRMIRDGNRASDVIRRLRALFVRDDAASQWVDLNDATREVIALSLKELQRNRLMLTTELARDLALVRGDRVQLQQVILNLLLNASDAMSGVEDRARQLVVTTQADEDERVRLTVRDAGVGLELENVDRVFEAFYTTKQGGMGIGLSVSRSIIERHNGRLWATPNQGHGTSFSFSIPVDSTQSRVVEA